MVRLNRFWSRLLVIVSLVVFSSPVAVQAAGVVGTGTPGSCTEAALNAALSGGGTVTFNCGPNPHTLTVTSQKVLSVDTVIDGGGRITLSGGNTTGILKTGFNLRLTVQNITFANGRSPAQGGAIELGYQNTLTVTNSSFSNNVATRDTQACDGGGALFLGGSGRAYIANSTFTSNQANNGGAINNLRTDLTLLNSTFTNNQAIHTDYINQFGDCGGGGAVYIDGANPNGQHTLLLQNNTFTGNTTNNHGGALFIGLYAGENVSIDTATFTNNRVTYEDSLPSSGTGGGVWYGSGDGSPLNPLMITNATFSGNHADTQGGGLWGSAPMQLTNVTFIGNDATNPFISDPYNWQRGNGGAIVGSDGVQVTNATIVSNTAGFNGGAFAGSGTSPTSPIVIRNTLIAHNRGYNGWGIQEQCTSTLTDGGNNFQYPDRHTNNWNDYNCLSTPSSLNPKVGVLANWGGATATINLANDSPAVNAANPATCPASDQRGMSRPQGSACDIGAYELGLRITPVVVGAGEPAFILLVDGAGFTGGSQITWNGAPQTTSYINSTRLTTTISAADISAPGDFPVSVTGATWTPIPLQVWANITRNYLPTVRR